MLAIRLQRTGRKKQAMYRLVVSEKTKDMYGDHLEILGNFNPHNKEAVLKNDRIEHWLAKGAQPSDTVHNLLVKQGIIKSDKKAKAVSISKKRANRGKDDKAEEKKDKPAEAPKEEAKPEDKPAEEVKEEKKEDKPVEAPAEEKPAEPKA
jgi:small subunit ribosomal protein S16